MSNKKSRKSGKGRTRNYATVVYPDSASSDWLDRLKKFLVPAFVSPLHDKDILPSGELKKPHWHVLLMFDSVKTIEQAKEVFEAINGVGCEKVSSLRGYARYLCHIDDPDKVQYAVDDVLCLSGADYRNVISLPSDKYKIISEMIDFCQENHISSYSELLLYCRQEKFDWFKILCDSGTYVMKEFLKSKDWTNRR